MFSNSLFINVFHSIENLEEKMNISTMMEIKNETTDGKLKPIGNVH